MHKKAAKLLSVHFVASKKLAQKLTNLFAKTGRQENFCGQKAMKNYLFLKFWQISTQFGPDAALWLFSTTEARIIREDTILFSFESFFLNFDSTLKSLTNVKSVLWNLRPQIYVKCVRKSRYSNKFNTEIKNWVEKWNFDISVRVIFQNRRFANWVTLKRTGDEEV